MPLLRSPTGAVVDVPDEQVGNFVGYEPVEGADASKAIAAPASPDRGVLGGINAAATGILSGATLGLSDYALKSVLNQGGFERLAAEREGHPVASGVGQIAGAVAPALLAPGSSFARALPSGALSSAVAPLAGRGAAGLLAAGAAEGAFQNAGAYLADTALGDRDLTAEGMFGALGAGGAFGVAGGVAALGIEKGTIAARRLFSRAAGSDKAALEAEHAWQAAHQSTLEAHDAAADIAKAQLAEARAAREQAQLAKQRAGLRVVETEQAAPDLDAAYRAAQVERDQVRDAAKAAYEATPVAQPAGPALTPEARGGLHDLGLSDADIAAAAPHELAAALRIVEGSNAELASTAGAALSPAKEASLAAAVAEHDAARLDLDDLLRNIEAPAIEAGVASGVRVPRGQFEDLTQRGPLAQGTPVQVTTVGKKLGEGTPADATSLLEPGSVPAFDPKSRTYHNPDMPWRKAEEFAPSEPATGIHERPSGLEDLVRMQREAGPTGLEELVRLQREAAPRSVETVRAEYDGVMARLKASKDVPERLRLSKQADALSDELDALGDFTPAVSKAPPKPAEPDRFAPGKDGVIPVLEHPTDEAANFILRRVRDQGVHWGTDHPLDPGKHFLGTLGIDWKVPAHKKTLMALMREGKVMLSRADLVGAMDPALVKSSEIHHMGSDFHFINFDQKARAALAKSESAATAAAHTVPAAPASELETALQGTAAKIDEGSTLGRIGAESPARAEYVANKAAKTEADAAHFRAAANERNYAGSAMAAAEREAQAAASGEFDKFFADLRRPKTRDAYVAQNIGRAMREEGNHAAALAKVEREWAELTAADAWAERAAVLEYEGGYSRTDAERIAREEMDSAPSGPGSESARSNPKRVEAARRAAAASVERRREIHSAVASNLPPELRTAWDHEGYKFLQQEAPRIRGVKDRISAASKISEAFTEQYGSASETLIGHEGDRFFRRAEIEAKHAESWANEQERKYYARAAREHGAMENVAAAAETITKYERAAAKLTEELGPAAPPAAQEAAKAFRAAEDEAERKTMARTTRAIDDGVDSQGRPRTVEYMARKESEARMAAKAGSPAPTAPAAPARPSWDELEAKYGKYAGQPPLPPTAEEAATAARAEAKGADVAYKRTKVAETEARIGARQAQDLADQTRAAAEASRPTAAGAVPGEMSTLGAVATAIGIAGEVGVPGVPHPRDIPVIGPLLSLYLKYKALKYATGRFVGRVGASGDTRLAALAAKTKDKIATAVDKTLGIVETGARAGRPAIVAAATVLGHRIFDDGEPDAKKGASDRELAAVRIREIANAASRPDLVKQYVARELRGVVDPDLHDAAERHLMARFEYLSRVMPKAPPPNPYSKREWLPSVADASTLAQRLAVVHDPTSAFDHPTPTKIDTLKNVSPKLLQMAQERLIDRIGDAKNPVPYEQRLRASQLFSVPLDDSMRPEHAAILATAHAPSPVTDAAPVQPGPPQSSIAANTNLSSVYRTGTERRAL